MQNIMSIFMDDMVNAFYFKYFVIMTDCFGHMKCLKRC